MWGGWNNRDYRDLFRFNLESVAQQDGGSYMGSIKFTQVLSDQSFLSVQAYRTYWADRYGYPDDDGDGFVEQGENGDFIDFFDYSDEYADESLLGTPVLRRMADRPAAIRESRFSSTVATAYPGCHADVR